MTPTAVTPAARSKRPDAGASPRGAAGPRTGTRVAGPRPSSPHPSSPRPAHRTPRQRATVPRAPRRVSGPAAPSAPSVPAAPSVPRRPVAPGEGRSRRTTRAPRPAGAPLGVRAVARLRSLPDHSLLDRVVRGRLWIPLLGVLLVGIVATQVEVLKLNASIGRSVVRTAQLQGDNATLRADVSRRSDDGRIEREAEALGMRMPAATQPLLLGGSTQANLPHALEDIHTPDATGFTAATAARAGARANSVVLSSGQ